MKFLAGFYVLCFALDWVEFLVGSECLSSNAIICYKGIDILVNTNLGAFYMLCLSLIHYFYSITMWYVFYKVPKNLGVVSSINRNLEKIGTEGDQSRASIKRNDDNLTTIVRELEHDREFTDH